MLALVVGYTHVIRNDKVVNLGYYPLDSELRKLSLKVQMRILSEITILAGNPEAGKLLKGSYTVKFADTTLRIKLRSFKG